jgi:hypothetical protein
MSNSIRDIYMQIYTGSSETSSKLNQSRTWNRALVRIAAPYRANSKGTGHRAKAINARRELPHPSPSALYIDGPARGRTAPTKDRNAVLAAVCEVTVNIMLLDCWKKV